jgi:glycosyltransferase involved in cell wall biosynthesis
MRILMTTDTVGGVWTFTQELAEGLLLRGCAVCLVSFGKAPSDAQRSWADEMRDRWGEHFQYHSSDIPLEWMDDNARAYSAAEPLLLRFAAEFVPDLVQSNQFCFGALPLAVPRIVVAHSDVLSWADACRGGRLEDSPWLRQYRSLVQDGLTDADAITAPTEWMLQALARNFRLPKDASVIPNGRTLAPSGTRSRKQQAVIAGRLWDEAKNIAMLRDLQSPIPLVVAGDDQSDSTVPPLHNTSFVGALPPEELHTLFRESSIYICTSRYEPFGLAPLEAALCGCAVLANDIPSLREVWQDGALYFSDASSLTALLRQLCSPQALHNTRQNSVHRAQFFTADRMVEGHLALFRKALARSEETVYAS